MAQAKAKLEEEVKQLRQIQSDIVTNTNAKAQLLAQIKEHEIVKQELELVEDEANIYKLIGPILIKQDKMEATANVSKRIDFMQNELKRLEAHLEESQKKQNDKRKNIMTIQSKLQQQQTTNN
jgi:prefoldin beta subunit